MRPLAWYHKRRGVVPRSESLRAGIWWLLGLCRGAKLDGAGGRRFGWWAGSSGQALRERGILALLVASDGRQRID
jgi:hypothetical protein